MASGSTFGRQTQPERVQRWTAIGFAVSATAYFAGSAALYLAYRQNAFDLGIYDQTIWLLAHGRLFNTVAGIHVFGAHFSPVLIALAPLSLLPGGALPELAFQSVILASGVFPAARLAWSLNRDPRVFVLLYAAHPAIITGSWFGFRPWNLAAPFLMWVAYLLWQRPTLVRFIALGALGLLLREDIALWVGLIGVLLTLARRMTVRHLMIGGLVLGAATVLVTQVLLPRWSPIETYLYGDTVIFDEVNVDLETGIVTVLARVTFLLLPLGLALRELARLPQLLVLLIPIVGLVSRGGNAVFPGWHYDMLFIPALVLITAVWAHRTPRLIPVVAGCVVVAFVFAPLRPWGYRAPSNPMAISAADVERFSALSRELFTLVKETDSVSVPNALVPHFAERAEIFLFPYPFDAPAREPYAMDCPDPRVVVSDASLTHLSPIWNSSVERYEPVYTDGRYTIYVRRQLAESDSCGPDT